MSAYPGISLAANGTSPPLPIIFRPLTLSRNAPCYGLGLILTFSAGASLTATAQVTGDPVPSDDGNWNNGLERQIDNENARDGARNIDRGPARHNRLRSDMRSRHDHQRAALAKRHEREMEQIMAKHPID